AHSVLQKEEFVLRRDEAYIGVLIDDLVTKGTKEPYRMFTSRAEHRLVLREDNSVDRLIDKGFLIGAIDPIEFENVSAVRAKRTSLLSRLRTEKIYPTAAVQIKMTEFGSPVLTKPLTFEELMRRDEIDSYHLSQLGFELDSDPNVLEPVEIEIKYAGYVKRQLEFIEQSKKLEELRLENELDYSLIKGLKKEEVEKLKKIRPRTLGQASRISGVNPSAVQAIMIFIKGRNKLKNLPLGECRGS
ncbi:MAG: tRNA uridine-5-carboxymethylaminomethyl(34) synthesis enzyme MnmG, partial [Pseudobdellovibrionaceae bacterium]